MALSTPAVSSPTSIPLVVLSGLSGTGKTSVARHLSHGEQARRLAVIPNSGHDADDASPGTHRDQLRTEIARVVQTGLLEGILVEASEVADPAAMAEALLEVEDGVEAHRVHLQSMVSVLDASTFLRDFHHGGVLRGTDGALAGDEDRTVIDLLIAQVEFANLIILNKSDLTDDDTMSETLAVVRALNPEARVLTTQHGGVAWDEILSVEAYDDERIMGAPGWTRALAAEESKEAHAGSFVFRTVLPFHPRRLWDFLHDDRNWRGVLRSKGVFWLASVADLAYEWSQAGGVTDVQPVGDWESASEDASDLHPRFGARMQQLAFVGLGLDETRIRRGLQQCLLDPSLHPEGDSKWTELENPFPIP